MTITYNLIAQPLNLLSRPSPSWCRLLTVTIKGVIYLSTISTTHSKALLEIALSSLLAAIAGPQEPPKSLYQLSYEQNSSPPSLDVDGNVGTFAAPSLSLAFDDSVLDPVRQAWNMVAGDAAEEGVEYMVFEDREGVTEEDDL